MEPIDAYRAYFTVRQHFLETYDYEKNGIAPRKLVSRQYEKATERKMYSVLGEEFKDLSPRKMMLALALAGARAGKVPFVAEILDNISEIKDLYYAHVRYMDEFDSNFKSDIIRILRNIDRKRYRSIPALIYDPETPIFSMVISGDIQLETLVFTDRVCGKRLKTTPYKGFIRDSMRARVGALAPFVKSKSEKTLDIVRDIIKIPRRPKDQ